MGQTVLEHCLLGKTRENPADEIVAQVLGKTSKIKFLLFESPFGISGLAREENSFLEILAIEASQPGTGQFFRFLRRAQAFYSEILILEVWNPRFDKRLEALGFEKTEIEREGEKITGRVWKR